MKMPQTIGLVHFIGIGGIGMSGIAEVLHNLGYRVQGSDQADERQRAAAARQGHRVLRRPRGRKPRRGRGRGRLDGDQERPIPNWTRRAQRLLPVVRRAEMLAELMRFRQAVAIGGTHGKTTTTSMVATLLDAGGLDPTVVNGGIINAYGTNARMGEGDWMVVEADESDGTFLKLPADVAVVTNIDPEHLDHYGSFDKVREAFRQFVENVPFYGFGVMCTDHPEVQALVARIEDRRVITYGENPQADVRFVSRRIDGAASRFDVVIRDRKTGGERRISDLRLPMPGRHNVSNATAAIAVAHELGISSRGDPQGRLPSFGGVKRRFTPTGAWNGVDDLRRLRPPSRRDQGGAAGGARADQGPRHRDRPAAPLHPPARPVRRVLRLLQRRRHGDRGAGLCGRRRRRSTASTPRRWSRASAPAATATRATSKGRRRSRPLVRELAEARRFRRLPRRRQHHPMGLCAAQGTRRRGCGMIRARRCWPDSATSLRDLRGRLTPNAEMDKITWFRAGGLAEVAVPAGRRGGSRRLPQAAVPEDIPLTVVGVGSNLLVREGGIPGVVVRLSAKGFGEAEVDLGHPHPGRRRHARQAVAAVALEAGIGGFHFYHGIPGAIGGALQDERRRQWRARRASAWSRSRARRPQGRSRIRFSNAEMGYAYRHSSAPADLIFTAAIFEGYPGGPGGDQGGDGCGPASSRDRAADPREDRRLDLQESGGHIGLEARSTRPAAAG